MCRQVLVLTNNLNSRRCLQDLDGQLRLGFQLDGPVLRAVLDLDEQLGERVVEVAHKNGGATGPETRKETRPCVVADANV